MAALATMPQAFQVYPFFRLLGCPFAAARTDLHPPHARFQRPYFAIVTRPIRQTSLPIASSAIPTCRQGPMDA